MTSHVTPQEFETLAVNLGCQLVIKNFEKDHQNDGDQGYKKSSRVDILGPIKDLMKHIFPYLFVVGIYFGYMMNK